MKKFAIAAAILGFLSVDAMAVEIEFRGALCIISLTQACIDDGSIPGSCVAARFTPPNVPTSTNGPSTRLTLVEPWSARNYTLPTGSLIGTAFQAVNGTGIFRGAVTFNTQIRFTSQVPARPAATSNSISILGDMKGADGVTGCDFAFRASLTRKQNIP